MSMLRDLDRRDALHDVVHLHSARTRGDVIWAQLRELAQRHPGLRLHELLTARTAGSTRPARRAVRGLARARGLPSAPPRCSTR
jgi:ferredoxin-NADP reductase